MYTTYNVFIQILHRHEALPARISHYRQKTLPAPIWIIGASWPHAIALDTEQMVPTIFTTTARRRRKFLTFVPLR